MFTRLKNILSSLAGHSSPPQGKAGPQPGKRRGTLPDWTKLLAASPVLWAEAKAKAANGPAVLIPTSVGGFSAVSIIETLLGVALTLRGARVRFLLCDASLPACLHANSIKIKNPEIIADYRLGEALCQGCVAGGDSVFPATGLPVSRYGDFLTPEDRHALRRLAMDIPLAEIPGYTRDGLALGEHAQAGALRFFARGQLAGEPRGEAVLRRYFESALLTAQVMEGCLDAFPAEAAVFHHGIYIPMGVIGEVARRRRVRIANWQVAYRKKCLIFAHNETYHHALISEPVANWEDIAWDDSLEKQLMAYLKSRWYGTEDWIWFHDEPQHDFEVIRSEVELDRQKPIVTLLTNVFWDAQLHYRANAFRDMLEWILESIAYFARRPDLQLVVRIHPAEVRGAIPSRQPLTDEIDKAVPSLPPNIRIVRPESQVSTYSLCEHSDAVIIYGTKTGVEATAMGIPVIVAGEAWIRGKGVTRDVSSPREYFDLLDTLPFGERLSPEQRQRARKYAFHFFFRRFIPLDFLEPCASGVPYEIAATSLEAFLPGQDPGLDVICDGILRQTEFLYPAENHIR
jgi:hypothetical protein